MSLPTHNCSACARDQTPTPPGADVCVHCGRTGTLLWIPPAFRLPNDNAHPPLEPIVEVVGPNEAATMTGVDLGEGTSGRVTITPKAVEATKGKRDAFSPREIPEAEWSGPVCVPVAENQKLVDAYLPNDGYFEHVQALRDWYYDEGQPLPAYVHGCTVRRLDLNAAHIIENATECEHHESVAEEASESADDLQKLLDQWCATLSARTWEEDPRIRVMLDPDFATPAPTHGAP